MRIPSRKDLISKRLSRRSLLKASLVGAAWSALPASPTSAKSSATLAELVARSRLGQLGQSREAQQSSAVASILVLVSASAGNPFGAYYEEILRLEGISDVEVRDLSDLTAGLLTGRSAVILGESTPNSGQVTLLSSYVASGGGLIAMRPASNLNSILGVSLQSGSLAGGYMRITDAVIGSGLYDDTMQFHGVSSRYVLAGASQVAELYTSRTASANQPTVTLATSGAGRAAMFSYDLARSIALTRQGDPANADIDVDADGAVRSVDIYNGWIDLQRSFVPQADMQSRLLARMIEAVGQRPMPRLWYFPDSVSTVMVLTGDAHANPESYYQRMVDELGQRGVGLTFFLTPTAPPKSVIDGWRSQGFDFGLHPVVDPDGYDPAYQFSYSKFVNTYGFQPVTARTHMVRWTGWSTAAAIQANANVEMSFDTYQWGAWLNNTTDAPARGYVAGSGLPMRYVSDSGQLLPIYQQHTNLIDEELAPGPGVADITYERAIALAEQTIDEAIAFHTVVATQFHVDYYAWANVNPWVLHSVDYVLAANATTMTAREWLTFVKARAATSITNIAWGANSLSFDVVAGGSNQTLLLPLQYNGAALIAVQRDGTAASYSVLTMSGRQYAAINATTGSYQTSYQPDTVAPVISNVSATPGSEQATIIWTTDEPATSTVDYGLSASFGEQETSSAFVTEHELQLANLTPSTTYYYQVTSVDGSNNSTTSATQTFQTLPPDAPVLESISPTSSQAGTQQLVTLTGQSFLAGATVTIGGEALTNIEVQSETTIEATVPASINAGSYDVTITNPDGQFSTLSDAYTVLAPPPSLTSISPSVVTVGQQITLTGENFLAGASVSIGTVVAESPTVINATQMTTVVPLSMAAGLYGVTVTNPDGQSAVLPDALTVSALPSVGHTTVADFEAGTLTDTAVRSGGQAGDGAVALASSGWLETFPNPTLDASRWSSGTWNGDGAVTVSPGQLQVTGAWSESQQTFGQGVIKARLTFDAGAWLNFGLSRADTIANPWFLFGVPGWDTSQVYARYNFGSTVGDVALGGFTGAPHDFAIEYNPGQSVRFIIDGEVVYERSITTTSSLAIWLSAGATGPTLTANSVEVASFASSGTYLSPPLDAGLPANWVQLLVDRQLPDGTAATARARSSNNALAWSSWSPVASSFPANLSLPEGRYLQYELALTTDSAAETPLVGAVNATYQEGEPIEVVSVVVTPETANLQPGATQQFSAQAFDGNGDPIPGVGFTWSVVNGGGSIDQTGLFTAGATTGTFTDTVVAATNGISDSASVSVEAAPGPQITSVAPQTATVGEVITITGSNFTSDATVQLGSSAVLDITFVDATELTFTVPTMPAGVYDVTVTNPDSQFSTLANGLEITPTSTPVEITETSEADFSAGTFTDTTAANSDGGEVRLVPSFVDEFDGSQLSADWTSGTYDPASSVTVQGGQASVAGGWIQSAGTYGPLSMTARVTAIANGQPYLNFGFGRAGALDYPWYLFGNSSWNTGGIYARSNDGGFYRDSYISGVDPTEPHDYTVQRLADQIIYKVDGETVITHNAQSWGNTTPLAFWFSAANTQHQISVDWVRIDQYAASGTFTSAVLDAGSVTSWSSIASDVVLPAGTGVSARVRTSTDGSTWSAWMDVAALGDQPATLSVPDGQYIQYELTLASDGSASPEVRSVTISGDTVV